MEESPRKAPGDSRTESPSINGLEDLLKRITDPKTGVPVQNRSWLLSTYKSCFVGKELVDWLINNKLEQSREAAVEFGNKLLENYIFHHVTRDHKFKDENLYYRFDKDWKQKLERPESWGRFVGNAGESGKEALQPSLKPSSTNMEEALKDLEVTPHDEHNIKLLDNVHPSSWQNPKPNSLYNMVVVGAGAAGLVTAAAAAGLGAKVALIERHLMGGDCLNYGCVPSKALIRCANAIHDIKRSEEFGVKISGDVDVDFPAIMDRMRKLRADISKHDSSRRYQYELNVDVFIGEGVFTGPNSIEVGGQTLKFTHACIATGARPAVPPIKGLSGVKYLTNETIFNLTELPKRLCVIGAGAIGCELSQAFARFGSHVTICARSDSLLAREDPEAVAIIEAAFKRDGVEVLLNCEFVKVHQSKSKGTITVTLKKNGEQEKVECTHLLISTGRKPNVTNMGLVAAGVKFTEKDGVIVNDMLQTSQSHIYACGDVCSAYKFTHVADAQARIVTRNSLFLGRAKTSELVIPWCTYTSPELAHVGPYARDLEKKGIKTATYIMEFKNNDRALLEGNIEGFVKVLCKEGSDTILAATVVHPNAGDLISELTVCITNKIGLGSLAPVIHPYPTQADAIRRLGDLYNRSRLTTFAKVFLRKLADR